MAGFPSSSANTEERTVPFSQHLKMKKLSFTAATFLMGLWSSGALASYWQSPTNSSLESEDPSLESPTAQWREGADWVFAEREEPESDNLETRPEDPREHREDTLPLVPAVEIAGNPAPLAEPDTLMLLLGGACGGYLVRRKATSRGPR